MKFNKQIVFTFLALVLVAALYRILPNRPWGFAPQIAMALFAGSVVKDRKYAFALPLLSMLVSDGIYELLHNAGLTSITGFYSGQFTNYFLFVGLTVIGFFINKNKVAQIGVGALVGPTIYFLISNFLVWLGTGGYQHPKTMAGLMLTYTDGIPFYTGSIYATILFSALLFGGYAILNSKSFSSKTV